jgi:glycine/D-amino acid oxidase-like deaminating enzyme
MDLRSHYPFWLLKNGIIYTYPSVNANLTCDVLIVGAGITGALVAWHLAHRGIPVVVLDKRHVGMGSTAASTSFLQYEIDTPLIKLRRLVGAQNADRSYLLCRNSIGELKQISKNLKANVSFALNSSFQFASQMSHVKRLTEEYKARSEIGIDVQLLEAQDVKQLFHFSKPGGILSGTGGQVDAYALTHALLKDIQKINGRVFDHSEVTGIKHMKKGVEVQVGRSVKIKARRLIIACGYESQKYLPKKVERIASTFAVISEPFVFDEFWFKNALIWETAMPYLYMKVTTDNRILVGGKDVPFYNPQKRDSLISSKARQLKSSFNKLFPGLEFKVDFQWAGTFSGTKDGLPYIGSIPARPHTFFAMGFGGNGITFSQIAGRLICDKITGQRNPDFDLFTFNR